MTSGPGCWERETSSGRFSTTAPVTRLPGGLNFAPAGYRNIKRAENLEAVLGASGACPPSGSRGSRIAPRAAPARAGRFAPMKGVIIKDLWYYISNEGI